jgi:hypothetical protein
VNARLKVIRLWERWRAPLPSSRAHDRRDTNTYPPTPNTTGIIINIPNTVLIIDFSIPLCPLLSRAGSWLSCGGRCDPELNDYVDSAAPPSPSPSG